MPIGVLGISFTVSLFVCPQKIVTDISGWRGSLTGLMQGNEIWQLGRPGWAAGHLLFL